MSLATAEASQCPDPLHDKQGSDSESDLLSVTSEASQFSEDADAFVDVDIPKGPLSTQ